jgi:hypothetical protein
LIIAATALLDSGGEGAAKRAGVEETVIELTQAVALLVGFYQRLVAWASAALLMSFALTMSIALCILAPQGYRVFTVAALRSYSAL